jgi:hypothetical protein
MQKGELLFVSFALFGGDLSGSPSEKSFDLSA